MSKNILRKIASKIYRGRDYTDQYPLEYYRNERGKDQLHPNTAAVLEQWLTLLAKEGEATAFDVVRKWK